MESGEREMSVWLHRHMVYKKWAWLALHSLFIFLSVSIFIRSAAACVLRERVSE